MGLFAGGMGQAGGGPFSGPTKSGGRMNRSPAETTQFDVHLFAVVRVKIPHVAAASHRDAIAWAVEHSGDLYERFAGADSEFAEEFSHFLVDVVGDNAFEQSQWFYCEQE